MKAFMSRFIFDEKGQLTVEFALVFLLIIATVSLMSSILKVQLSNLMTSIGTKLNSAVNIIS